MFELAMAASGRSQQPPVILEQAQNFGDLHTPNYAPGQCLRSNSRPNDQVERRADATPAQKEDVNRHVRSNAGLGSKLM